MAINPLGSSSYYNNYLTDSLTDKKSDAAETAEAMLANYKGGKNAYSAYGANMYSGPGQSAMQRAINEIKEKNGGAVTFGMVTEYREELEGDFKTVIMAGLAMLGLEDTDEFQMVATPDGEIAVMSDDPEVKAAVSFLLEETPKLKEQFLYIQALGNIERAKGTMSAQAQMGYTQASLAGDAVDILLNGSALLEQFGSGGGLGYSTLMAQYSQNSIQYMLGANYMV